MQELFMRALEKSEKIRFLLTRHEQGAAFMADVYGRLTGKPGVCLGTLGPGATNLVTGVADANMDRAPCICLTGQADAGSAVHVGVCHTRDQVGGAGPERSEAHPGLAGEPAVDICHEGRALLVTREQEPDLLRLLERPHEELLHHSGLLPRP